MNIQKAAKEKQYAFHQVLERFMLAMLQSGPGIDVKMDLEHPVYDKPAFEKDELTFLSVTYRKIGGVWGKRVFGRLATFCAKHNLHYSLYLNHGHITFFIKDFKYLPDLEEAES